MKKTTHFLSSLNCFSLRFLSNPIFRMNTIMKIFIFGIFLCLNVVSTYGQYSETFPTADKGILAGTCSGSDGTTCASNDFTGVDWVVNGNLSMIAAGGEDFVKVESGALTFEDIDEEVCFETPEMNISAVVGNFSISVDVGWFGFDEADYINVEYNIDGGGWTQVANTMGGGAGTIQFMPASNNAGSTTVNVTGLSGTSTLSVRVCGDINLGTISGNLFEQITVDNVSVPEAGVSVPGSGPTVSCSSTDVQCDDINGSSDDGTATAAAADGTAPYTYLWSDGGAQTTATATGLAAGMYTVTVTDNDSNTATCTATVASATTLTLFSSATDASCNGDSDGSVDATAGGGAPGYTYAWNTGATSEDISGLSAGTYTVTVSDSNGCTNTSSATVAEPSAVTAMTSATDASCNGDSDGSVDATAGGGTPGYTYAWNTGATSEDISGVSAGTYTVTISDSNGCTNTSSATVAEPSAVTAMTSATDASCNGDSDGSVDATAGGGTPGYTYAWNTGATSEDISGVSAGTYTVTISDSNGCTNTSSATVAEPSAVTAMTSATDVSCNGDSDGSVDATAGGGTPGYTYAWNTGATSEDISGVSAGTYTVTISDSNGCTNTSSATVAEPSAVTAMTSATDASCNGDSDGSVDATAGGGTPGYTYAWNTGATSEDISGVSAGTYTVTISDSNGCTNTSSATVAEPSAVTAMTSATDASCNGDSDGSVDATAGGGTPGYTYAWNTGATSEDISGVSAGTYTVTISDSNGCTNTSSATVAEPSAVTAMTSATDASCNGDSDGSVDATAGGGTPGYTYAWNTGATSEDISGVSAGTYTVTISDSNGCTNTSSATVGEPSAVMASFTALADLCIDAGVQSAQGGGTPIGGVYSGPGVTDNSNGMDYDFDPMTAGVGVHTITYTYTDGNGCMGIASDMVEVFALPMVTLMTPMDICITSGVMTFGGGTPTGGVYSGPGVSDNSNGMDYDFDPLAAGLGMHTIMYDFTDMNGCSNSAMGTVNVTPPLPVTLTIPPAMDTLCVDAGLQVIANAGSPAGGVYSGPGVTDDGNGMSFTFDPAGAGSGLHLITYTVTGMGCSGMFTDFIHVFDLPIVTFSIPAAQDTFCADAAAEVISIAGSPPGGVYSGPGVTDDGNGTSFTFDASAAGVGFHILTYTYTDAIGCSNSFDDFIQVLALPVVAFTAPADLCVDAGVQAGLGGGTPSGGVYSGDGVTDDGNGMTYSFDPAGAGVGVNTITYTFSDAEGCSDMASDDVEVFDLPVVTFTALADLCIDAGVQAAQGGGTPSGGVYSGDGVTDNGNGTDYDFDPMTAGVGTHTITYTYTDGDGCVNSASDDVEVFDLPTVIFTALADLCIDAGVQSAQGGGTPTGGTYSGPGVTDNGNGMDYDFDPMTAGVGVHTITYTYTDGNSCTNSASDMVEVFDLPIVTFTALADLCIDAGVQSAQGGGSPTGGVYSGTGVTDNGNGMDYDFDPMAAGAGTHTITYTYTDGNGCVNSASDDVEVFDLPVVSFTALADLCIDAGVQASQGGGSPTGGVYSGDGVTDNGNGLDYDFDPMAAGVGTHTITYTYTDGNGCVNSASDDVEVFDLPVVTFTALADLCIDAGVQAAQGGGTPTGGVYSGPGVTDNGNGLDYDFDPMAAGAGVHTITYDYTDANGCMNSASDDVQVFDLPVVTFTALADLCIDAGVQAAQGGGSPTGGVYSGDGVTDNGNGTDYDFDPMAAGAGTHTITYTYTDGNGCVNSASDDVEVFDLPTVTFTALADLCIDAGVQSTQGGGSPTGGVYSGDGVTDNGNGLDYDFDPMAAGVGVHTITYTYTDGKWLYK